MHIRGTKRKSQENPLNETNKSELQKRNTKTSSSNPAKDTQTFDHSGENNYFLETMRGIQEQISKMQHQMNMMSLSMVKPMENSTQPQMMIPINSPLPIYPINQHMQGLRY